MSELENAIKTLTKTADKKELPYIIADIIKKNCDSSTINLLSQYLNGTKPSEAMECLENIEADLTGLPKHVTEYDDGFDNYLEDIWNNISTIKQTLLKAKENENLLKSGDLSDGYHTFNQLYYQRCVLFASLVRLNKEKSWKSFKHSDNKYCFDSNGEWFIVGIDTPIGSYTYHYEKKYWDLFECQELECGKEWDGHTEEDVARLLSLPNEQDKVLDLISSDKCDFIPLSKFKNWTYDLYVKWFDLNHYDVKYLLTQEEFDLLKRYVK